jgi:hypothetical protein
VAVLKDKSRKIIPFLFPVLTQTSILPMLFTRVADDTFTGTQGDTVSMRVPGVNLGLRAVARKYEWRERRAPIVTDDIVQSGRKMDLTFGVHTYSATELTDEHFTMDEVDLATEVVMPQAESVAKDLEYDIQDAFGQLRTKVTLAFNPGDDPYDFAVDAQAELSGFKVAPNDGNRTWLVGTNVAKEILKSDRITRYDSFGQGNQDALLRGQIANLAGLNIVQHTDVNPNFSMIFHKTGLIVGTVAPKIPPTTAVSGARLSQRGFALRHIIDYDSSFMAMRSVVSCFSGINPLYDERIGGTGVDAMDLKIYPEGVLPVSVRMMRVNFNGTAQYTPW